MLIVKLYGLDGGSVLRAISTNTIAIAGELSLVLFGPNISWYALPILMPRVFKGHLLQIFHILPKFIDIISLKVHRAGVLIKSSVDRHHRNILRSIHGIVSYAPAAFVGRPPAIIVVRNI